MFNLTAVFFFCVQYFFTTYFNNLEYIFQDMSFEFENVRSQNWIVEGEFNNQFYYHFNFAAKQACSSVFTFFAEISPEDGDDCEVICCNLLNDDDNGTLLVT